MNWKRILKWAAGFVAVVVGLAGVVVGYQIVSFNRSIMEEYDVLPLDVVATTDSAVLARGRHLAESIGGCLGCHGPGLAGSPGEDMGPIAKLRPSNLTTGRGGLGGDYTDGELARAVKHGIDSDGRTLLFMPSQEYNWWPESDLVAVVSFVRSLPPVDGETEPTSVGLLGKVLSQFGLMDFRSAASIDHDAAPEDVPDPEPTARYGGFLSRGCTGCHGERLSGGRIPGAPSSLATPANLTFHETGLAGWTREDFDRALNTGVRPDGRELDPFMPIVSTRAMNEIEKTALWEYLRSIDPVEFGNR